MKKNSSIHDMLNSLMKNAIKNSANSNSTITISSGNATKVIQGRVTTTYKTKSNDLLIENNQVIIDGKQITPNDPRIISQTFSSNDSYQLSEKQQLANDNPSTEDESEQSDDQTSSVFHTKKKQKISDELDDYSPAAKSYIERAREINKNTKILAELKLSSEEEKLLEEFQDPISFKVMDIPVTLYENQYDLNTLLQANGVDPLTNYKFTLRDIQPARKIQGAIEDVIKQIKVAREKQDDESQQSSKHLTFN